ncbi:MAG: hypothetical protein ACRDXX_06870, partial [Stackebrandtia sp.]
GAEAGQTPHRSVATLAVLTSAVAVAAVAWSVDLEELMRATSACLAAVTVAGVAAGVRLLPGRAARLGALAATGFTGVVLASLGWRLLIPAAIAAAALGFVALKRLRSWSPRLAKSETNL